MSETKLQAAFVEGLGLDDATGVASLAYRGIEQWDSLAHMHLIAEIEAAFDIMLDTEDVIDMSSYVRAREILQKYGVEF